MTHQTSPRLIAHVPDGGPGPLQRLGLPGVVQVLTHENTPRLARSDRSYRDEADSPGSPFRPLHDAEIKFSAQPVALVVANTFELARYAASLVRVEYDRAPHATDRRAQYLRTTPTGATLASSATRSVIEGEQHVLGNLSKGEQLILIELLHKVAVSRRV